MLLDALPASTVAAMVTTGASTNSMRPGTAGSTARPATAGSGSTAYSTAFPAPTDRLIESRDFTARGGAGAGGGATGRPSSTGSTVRLSSFSAPALSTDRTRPDTAPSATVDGDAIAAEIGDIIEDAEAEAQEQADRLADLRVIERLDGIPVWVVIEHLVQARPMAEDYFLAFDEPLVSVIRASGLPADEFLTHAELQRLRQRKHLLATFTSPIEEAAAQRVAGGLMDAITECVASYLAHLHVSSRRSEGDISAVMGASGRASTASWSVGTALTTPVMSGRESAVTPTAMSRSSRGF